MRYINQLLAVASRPCNTVLQGGPKTRPQKLMTIILSNLNRFSKFFTGGFFSKFVVNWLLEIPPHLASVATLPCKTLMSER